MVVSLPNKVESKKKDLFVFAFPPPARQSSILVTLPSVPSSLPTSMAAAGHLPLLPEQVLSHLQVVSEVMPHLLGHVRSTVPGAGFLIPWSVALDGSICFPASCQSPAGLGAGLPSRTWVCSR